MSGHSKWSQIKRQKGVADQKRGVLFSKLSRLITLAVREGGGITDPSNNIKLRLAVDRARAENMPKSNIERAIERVKGLEMRMKEVVYEGFGPSGTSFIISAATDNPNRTHNAIKNTLEKHGGKMGSLNSVSYLFDKCGVVVFEKKTTDEMAILTFSDKIEALDIEDTSDSYIIYIPFEKLGHVTTAISGLTIVTSDVFYRPKSVVAVSPTQALSINQLVERLEELDDVDKVYSNYEVLE